MASAEDPRRDAGAYVTDGSGLYRVLAHEALGCRVWVEDCRGVKHPDVGTYHFHKRWFSDAEIRRDFRLVKAAPAPTAAEPIKVAA